MEKISNWVWNDKFWFPEGCSFDDVKSNDEVTYAQPRDLYLLPIYGLIVFVLRHAYERYVSKPLSKRILPSDLIVAEDVHENGFKKESAKQLNGGTNARYCDRRKRKMQKMKSMMAKVAETSWKSLYHSLSFAFGLGVLWQASWFWESKHCYTNFPKHPLWPSLYYYYMIEGAYYIALMLCLATDVKRTDRNMMMIHHVGTIVLIVFSYASNHTRIGSLIMILHQPADMLLQIAKLLLYCKHKTLANLLFVVFVLMFLITRIYIFPVYIIYEVMFKFSFHYSLYPWYFIAFAICLILLILHSFWAVIILKMLFKVFTKGPLERDDRSGTEEESSEEETKENQKQK